MESLTNGVVPFSFSNYLSIKDCCPVGRGIYAKKNFQEGELIESVPVILIPENEWKYIEKTVLYNYCYAFGKNNEDYAIALGFGSLYNHSFTPNAKYVKHIEEKTIDFLAFKAINIGEEITINYNGESNSLEPMWFDVC